jgi:hypothetical protein
MRNKIDEYLLGNVQPTTAHDDKFNLCMDCVSLDCPVL